MGVALPKFTIASSSRTTQLSDNLFDTVMQFSLRNEAYESKTHCDHACTSDMNTYKFLRHEHLKMEEEEEEEESEKEESWKAKW